MSNISFIKSFAAASAMLCAFSAHAVIRGGTTPKPVVYPPVIRPVPTPPVVVPPGTVVSTPVVVVNTCTSGQASRC